MKVNFVPSKTKTEVVVIEPAQISIEVTEEEARNLLLLLGACKIGSPFEKMYDALYHAGLREAEGTVVDYDGNRVSAYTIKGN